MDKIITDIGEEGFILDVSGQGKGGGGGGSVEAKNTLYAMQTVKALNAISEGPIHGVCNVYFDDVNIVSFNDYTSSTKVVKLHIPNVEDGTIQHGQSHQEPIVGFLDTENEISINADVTKLGGPVTFSVSNTDVKNVNITIVINALFAIDGQGNINGNKTSFTIEKRASPTSVWISDKNITIQGKCNNPYAVSYGIVAPANADLWEIRVTKTSDDNDSAKVKNGFKWSSMTEIINSNLGYDDTALVALAVDARATSNKIPITTFDVAGIKILVPSNYTPRLPIDVVAKTTGKLTAKWIEDFTYPNNTVVWPTRSQVVSAATYTGVWDGNFKTQKVWCDNPVWVLYDILTNERYGLGTRIKKEDIDIYSFYDCAVYCDELVSDGAGGYEPRYSFNGCIQVRDDAFKVLQNLASSFHASLLDVGGVIQLMQDRPLSVSQIITNSDVISGDFEYSSSGLGSRHTVANVTYNDPHDRFLVATVSETDSLGVARYGYNTADEIAVGCTSEAQARRHARWRLYTDLYTTSVVSFKVALRNCTILPGELVEIQDQNFAEVVLHALVVAADSTSITLSHSVTLVNDDYTVDYYGTTPNSAGHLPILSKSIIQKNGTFSTITFSSPLTEIPNVNTTVILKGNTQPQLFKIISISESSPMEYDISAVEYKAEKFTYMLDGIIAKNPKYNTSIGFYNNAPTNVRFEENVFTDATNKTSTELRIDWDAPDDGEILYGQADGGSLTTIILPSESHLATDFYKNYKLYITGGAGVGQSTFIKTYNPATRSCTFTTPIYTALDNTSIYSLTPPPTIVKSYTLSYIYNNGEAVVIKDIVQPYYIIENAKFGDYSVSVTASNIRGVASIAVTDSYNFNDHKVSPLYPITDFKVDDNGLGDFNYNGRDVLFSWKADSRNKNGVKSGGITAKPVDYQVDFHSAVGDALISTHIVSGLTVLPAEEYITTGSSLNNNQLICTSLIGINNYYNGYKVTFHDNNDANDGLTRTIIDYDGATGKATLDSALPVYIVADMSFTIVSNNSSENAGGKLLYKLQDNINDFTTATRQYTVKVYARDNNKRLSVPYIAYVNNPVPAAPTVTVTSGIMCNNIKIIAGDNSEIKGYKVYASLTQGFSPVSGELIYDGNSTQCIHNVNHGGVEWYYRVAAYDYFDNTLGLWSIERHAMPVDTLTQEQIDIVTQIGNDNVLNAIEKKNVLSQWNAIVSEHASLLLQSSELSISYSAYDAQMTALADYLNGGTTLNYNVNKPLWLNSDNININTPIVNTVWEGHYKDYYAAKDALVKLIQAKQKQLADAAKAAADAAQLTADTAVSDASAAQSDATQALADSSSALSILGDISSDGKIALAEKPQLFKEWLDIYNEYPSIHDSPINKGILNGSHPAIVAYENAYNTLSSYLIASPILLPSFPLSSDLTWQQTTATINVNAVTFRTNFTNYYSKKIDLLNAVQDALDTKAVDAQSTANTAVSDAAAALLEAQNATADAENANNAISDISNDNIITVNEKPVIFLQYKAIYDEYTDILSKANYYSTAVDIEKTAYSLSYNSLVTYMTAAPINIGAVPADSWVTNNTKITIDGTLFRSKFSDYYAKRQILLNKMSETAKAIADGAQSTANTAVSDAADAQNAADAAQSDATSALGYINDMSDDNKITKSERPYVFANWKPIFDERVDIESKAITFAVDKTDYINAYNTLANYLTSAPISIDANPTDGIPWVNGGTITIVGSTFRNNFNSYYLQRQILLNNISLKAKTLADAAQSDADAAQADATQALADALAANNEISDISNDNKIVKAEKPTLVKDWQAIYNEYQNTYDKGIMMGIADAAGSKTRDYRLAYTSLKVYLESSPIFMPSPPTSAACTTWANATNKITIVGADMRDLFVLYYNSKQALLNYIVELNKGTTDTLLASITDISDDNKITKNEKPSLFAEWKKIYEQKPKDLSAWDNYYINSSGQNHTNAAYVNYVDAYNALVTYLTAAPISIPSAPSDANGETWCAIASSITIVGSDMRATFSAYYNTRTLFRSNIDNGLGISISNANYELAGMGDDNTISYSEKTPLYKEWLIIYNEQTDITAKATLYAITTEKTAYTTAYSALATYLTAGPIYIPATPTATTTWTQDTAAIDVTPASTFRTKFLNYYTTKQALLNAIDAKSKTIGDAAQASANTANGAIADISNDGKISQSEKSALFIEFKAVYDEKPGLITKATSFGISYTAYETAYTNLFNYLTGAPISIQNPPTDGVVWVTDASAISITATDYRAKWNAYYIEKQNLINELAQKAKTVGDNAQGTADSALTIANSLASKAVEIAYLQSDATTTVIMPPSGAANRTDVNLLAGAGGTFELPSLPFDNYKIFVLEVYFQHMCDTSGDIELYIYSPKGGGKTIGYNVTTANTKIVKNSNNSVITLTATELEFADAAPLQFIPYFALSNGLSTPEYWHSSTMPSTDASWVISWSLRVFSSTIYSW